MSRQHRSEPCGRKVSVYFTTKLSDELRAEAARLGRSLGETTRMCAARGLKVVQALGTVNRQPEPIELHADEGT